MDRYDLIVVGGGTAGLVTAAGAAGLGARVALVERERLGGECLWTGCVPSKALLACGKAAAGVRAAGRYGVHAEPRIDFGEAMRWVHRARERIAPNDSPERFRSLGVDVIHGTARFTAHRMLDVDGRALTSKRIVIATGSRPALPAIPGLDTVAYLTNETVFELTQRPGHLVILGAGPVGLELAQAFVRLGTRVTVIERGARLLPREEVELAGLLGDHLVADGVTLELGAAVTAVRRSDYGVVVTRTLNGTSADVGGTHLLVATGRASRTDTMDLDRGGVEIRDGSIAVDAHLRTTAPGVWACGDCVGGPRLTHVADYQARLVIRNAFFPFRGKADYSAIPWVTYTDPELAHVGLTEREARERHGSGVRAFTRPFTEVDRAIADGRTAGGVKLVTSARGILLGGHILGSGAGDMIGEVALAVARGLSINALGKLVHAYPSMPEAIRQAAQKYDKARFTGPVQRLTRWLVRR
ncbi:MAG: pyridine nucleotide-disulfide oxidoreductase dimerization region [Gemmatimonadetes bacterium]|nr:pyridine nucleotide-disulfide oxidoreductase dimerization region [Gemmatimonadota bacterium]